MNRKSELIVALDVHDLEEMLGIVDTLPQDVSWYKVGLELFSALGMSPVEMLKARGKNVFLDLKLHDIPRTVARSVAAIAKQNVSLLTLHAAGGRAMLSEAARARDESGGPLKLIAVTTLTSLSASDMAEIGFSRSPKEQAVSLGRLAMDAGIEGLVTSALEVPVIRQTLGDEPILVTPGIRMPHEENSDQQRVATPALAVEYGADFLVVGRPIVQADHPADAALRILDDMNRK